MRARSTVVLTMTGRLSAAQFTGPLSFAVSLGKHTRLHALTCGGYRANRKFAF
jgi:hypothetical protein